MTRTNFYGFAADLLPEQLSYCLLGIALALEKIRGKHRLATYIIIHNKTSFLSEKQTKNKTKQTNKTKQKQNKKT